LGKSGKSGSWWAKSLSPDLIRDTGIGYFAILHQEERLAEDDCQGLVSFERQEQLVSLALKSPRTIKKRVGEGVAVGNLQSRDQLFKNLLLGL